MSHITSADKSNFCIFNDVEFSAPMPLESIVSESNLGSAEQDFAEYIEKTPAPTMDREIATVLRNGECTLEHLKDLVTSVRLSSQSFEKINGILNRQASDQKIWQLKQDLHETEERNALQIDSLKTELKEKSIEVSELKLTIRSHEERERSLQRFSIGDIFENLILCCVRR